MIETKGYPPLYAEILKVFPMADRPGVVFSWGDKVYVPDGRKLPPYILAHEAAHGARQGKDVEKWWGRYLAEPAFRLEEEVIGHRAEYKDLLQSSADRNRRAAYLAHVATKLASPLYGGMVTIKEAQRLLTAPAPHSVGAKKEG